LLPPGRSGDFAQAMMDLGATICTPKKPACALCPWMDACAARKRGDQESFPRKAPKRTGELRRGAAFVALRADGAVLARNRPPRGLLGGMTEVPGSEWSKDFDAGNALAAAPKLGKVKWEKLRGTVSHIFTHFPLELTVFLARVPQATKAPAGMRWVAGERLAGEAFPNVMRKVLTHALDAAARTSDQARARGATVRPRR
jgi:A/G-specific adenine glycosylase